MNTTAYHSLICKTTTANEPLLCNLVSYQDVNTHYHCTFTIAGYISTKDANNT